MNKTRLAALQIIIYGIDGDGGGGGVWKGDGDIEGDEEKVLNILPKKVLKCHGNTL